MAGVNSWYLEGDRVLVKPDMLDALSEGRHGAQIIIPDTAREDRRNMGTTGELIQVGPSAELYRNMPNGERVMVTNDMLPMKVVHAAYGGMMVDETEIDESTGRTIRTKYRIMRDDDIAMFTDES